VAIYLAPISTGLGDLIVSLPALQALIQTGQPTYLISRTPMQEGLEHRIPGLAGIIRETVFDENSLSAEDVYFNLRNHPLQTDYIWGSAQFEKLYPGYKITDVLKGICADYGIAADYDKLTPLPFEKRNEAAGAVVIVPGSAGIVKCWPSYHWIDLAGRLSQTGHKILVVGQPDRSQIVKECVDAGLEHINTAKIEDALDVLSSAQCVIAGDTGLMHMAVQQNIPTVAIFRYNVMFMRDYPHVRTLAAPICHQPCIDLEFSAVPNKVISFDSFAENKQKVYWETWECTKESWPERCMSMILPEHVAQAVNELVSLSAGKR
jgi:ADP-heptose:LPS heptosyltransferase